MTNNIIYIYNKLKPTIENVQHVNINDLSTVSNGSAQNIVCDCIDSLTLEERDGAFGEIFKKARIGGSIVLKTINKKIFARSILYDKISNEDCCRILANINSLCDDESLYNLISRFSSFVITDQINDGIFRTTTINRVK